MYHHKIHERKSDGKNGGNFSVSWWGKINSLLEGGVIKLVITKSQSNFS
jgi:hypothetical protein